MVANTDFESIYNWHSPQGTQPERYQTLRDRFRGLAQTVEALCPESRERSLALTYLEQASMWASAAIARNETRVD